MCYLSLKIISNFLNLSLSSSIQNFCQRSLDGRSRKLSLHSMPLSILRHCIRRSRFALRMGTAPRCIPNKVVITHSWDATVNFHPRQQKMDPCALGYREDTLLEFIPWAVIAGVSSLDSSESRRSRGDSFCRELRGVYITNRIVYQFEFFEKMRRNCRMILVVQSLYVYKKERKDT